MSLPRSSATICSIRRASGAWAAKPAAGRKGLAQLKFTGENKCPGVVVSTSPSADSGCQLAHTSVMTAGDVGAQSSLERSPNLVVLFIINIFQPFHLDLKSEMVILKEGKGKECETVPKRQMKVLCFLQKSFFKLLFVCLLAFSGFLAFYQINFAVVDNTPKMLWAGMIDPCWGRMLSTGQDKSVAATSCDHQNLPLSAAKAELLLGSLKEDSDDNKREKKIPQTWKGPVQMADGNSHRFLRNLLFLCLVARSLHTQEFVMSHLFHSQ